MARPPLGDQQLDLFRFVTENAPVTAREVVEQYGVPRDLARTTILTMLEKLRAKGYLVRTRKNGTYHYMPSEEEVGVWQDVIHQFVEKVLGGRLGPFVAYLAQARGLTDAERAELEKLVRAVQEPSNGNGAKAKE